jgi:1-acyl-sn-glycerol-3-phosphate acyltransferase
MTLIIIGLILAFGSRLLLGQHWYLHSSGRRIIHWWMRSISTVIGLKIDVQGEICARPVLVVSNHISWVDVIAISVVSHGVFVAKSDVMSWPILGRLAAMSGTRFIARETVSSLREVLDETTQLLEQGERVVIFPEGTSTSGSQVMRFSSAVFQAPITAGAMVQAVALQYRRNGELDRLAPFINDDVFVPHLLHLLKAKDTRAYLTFEKPIPAFGHKRQGLAEHTQGQIVKRLKCCGPAVTAGINENTNLVA